MAIFIIGSAAYALALSPTGLAGAPVPGKVDYNFAIRPILADRCFLCHGQDERNRKADLRLDIPESAYAKAIVAGKPEDSELMRRITAGDHTRMPPKKSNLSLAKDEIELLRRWIAEGAEYKKHWAFLALSRQGFGAGSCRSILAAKSTGSFHPGAPGQGGPQAVGCRFERGLDSPCQL